MNLRPILNLLFIGTLFIATLGGCTKTRTVTITGYIYPNEKVEISYNGEKWAPTNSNLHRQPGDMLVFDVERKVDASITEFRANLDSAGIVLLDTLLIVPIDIKRPLISFGVPKSINPWRQAFTADMESEEFIKY